MPVVVACECGQRFAAQDHLIGQQVPCPVCGRQLAIGTSAAPPVAAPPQAQGIYVTCSCGGAFLAPKHLRGQAVKCPNCSQKITVPADAVRPLGPAAPAVTFGMSPLTVNSAPSPFDADKLARMMPKLAIGAVVLLVLAIAISSLANLVMKPRSDANDVAKATSPASGKSAPEKKSTTTSAPSSAPKSSGPAAPAPPSAVKPEMPSTAADAAPGSPGGECEVAQLPKAVQAWHQQPGAALKGVRRVGATESASGHFSWLTGLLPFLGHNPVYEKLDFYQPASAGANLQVGGIVIPEFLNPLDDRERWKGFPFSGIALTHFAGMSGVEDARNVVAAKLPRSDPRAGVFGYDEVARAAEITDGTSQTVMVVGTGALPNPWLLGGGATIRGAREPLFDKLGGLGTKGIAGGGTVAVMADGSVRQVTGNVDPQVFRAMCTIHGKDAVDVQQATQAFSLESLGKRTTGGEQPGGGNE